jgi:hypothetical protein
MDTIIKVLLDLDQDTSPYALRKAFIVVGGVLVPDPRTGEDVAQIEEMIKAFDEHQEIFVD